MSTEPEVKKGPISLDDLSKPQENVIPKECEYIAGAGIFYWAFYYEEDAMAFKLRWA